MVQEIVKSLFWWVVHIPRRVGQWLETAPRRLVDWYRKNRHERWGYFWWGLSGVVVAVPELWAALGGDGVFWPTISGTGGNLEVFHPWVSLIVVVALVWAAFHAISVTGERLREAALTTSSHAEHAAQAQGRRLALGDRFTVATDPKEIDRPLWYLGFAVAAVAVPSALFHHFYRAADHRYVFGEVMYASIAFWWMVIPGWLAYKRGALVPFPTLFRTLKDLEGRFPRFTLVVASGLAILMVHLILYPWPSTIPDTSRLHHVYECHPLKPPKNPPSEQKKEECRKLDQADLRPPADAA